MSDSIASRLRALEKQVGAEQDIRRAFTHAQLVRRAHLECTWRKAHPGEEPTPELVTEWEVEVGPPEAVLGPGEKSAGELITECITAAREREAAMEGA